LEVIVDAGNRHLERAGAGEQQFVEHPKIGLRGCLRRNQPFAESFYLRLRKRGRHPQVVQPGPAKPSGPGRTRSDIGIHGYLQQPGRELGHERAGTIGLDEEQRRDGFHHAAANQRHDVASGQ
jgi:hypothetical protein